MAHCRWLLSQQVYAKAAKQRLNLLDIVGVPNSWILSKPCIILLQFYKHITLSVIYTYRELNQGMIISVVFVNKKIADNNWWSYLMHLSSDALIIQHINTNFTSMVSRASAETGWLGRRFKVTVNSVSSSPCNALISRIGGSGGGSSGKNRHAYKLYIWHYPIAEITIIALPDRPYYLT